MTEAINYSLKILTVCQAVWVLTLMGFLMWHYTWKSVKNRYLEKNALTMGISYSFLTICTMISSLRGYYNWTDIWQILLVIGYGFGDYAIVRMLFHVTRNEKTKKVIREYIENEKLKNDA